MLKRNPLVPAGLFEPWLCSRCRSHARSVQTQTSISTRQHKEVSNTNALSRCPSKLHTWLGSSRSSLTYSEARQYRTDSPVCDLHLSVLDQADRRTQKRAEQDGNLNSMSQDLPSDALLTGLNQRRGIRKHLAEWQEKYGMANVDLPTAFSSADTEYTNDAMRLQSSRGLVSAAEPDDGHEEQAIHMLSGTEDSPGAEYEYLSPGDLVEIT